METDTATKRDQALRNAIVATVDASRFQKRMPRKRLLVGGLALFVAAGALTGGAASAAVITGADQSSKDVSYLLIAASDPTSLIEENAGHLVGQPFTLVQSGAARIDMGTRPAGATDLVVGVRCIDNGDFTVALDGKDLSDFAGSCTSASKAGNQRVSTFRLHGVHALVVTAPASLKYALWASWAHVPAAPAMSSEQQVEISDGKIDRQEYLSAYNRFAGCMSEAGYPIGYVPQNETELQYALLDKAVSSGADNRCYLREFAQVDKIWQTTH